MPTALPMDVDRTPLGPADYWHGEGRLWKIFWIYGVLVSVLAGSAILFGIVSGVLTTGQLACLLLLGLAYTAFVVVAIWRCAANLGPRPLGIERDVWSALARVLTIGWIINVIGLSLMALQASLGLVA